MLGVTLPASEELLGELCGMERAAGGGLTTPTHLFVDAVIKAAEENKGVYKATRATIGAAAKLKLKTSDVLAWKGSEDSRTTQLRIDDTNHSPVFGALLFDIYNDLIKGLADGNDVRSAFKAAVVSILSVVTSQFGEEEFPRSENISRAEWGAQNGLESKSSNSWVRVHNGAGAPYQQPSEVCLRFVERSSSSSSSSTARGAKVHPGEYSQPITIIASSQTQLPVKIVAFGFTPLKPNVPSLAVADMQVQYRDYFRLDNLLNSLTDFGGAILAVSKVDLESTGTHLASS